ncbi:hypothetical protein [Streptomyces sp. NPDC049879]|uniref:hypothetical protein n=1 Tax=Streptomyces sp. NPDC049879 TaxID=3365598 RepID=UPI0037B606BD
MYTRSNGISQDASNQIVVRKVAVPQWTDADLELPAEVRRKLADSVPEETRRKYDMWWGKAARWCQSHGRTVLPMSTQTMTTWVDFLTTVVSVRTGEPYAVASLNQAVAAIVSYHEAVEQSPPGTRQARELIRAHGASLGREVRRSSIITPDQLLDVVRLPQCNPRQDDPIRALVAARNRFMALVSFNAWDRRSEFVTANLNHFGVADQVLRWRFPKSKTDQAGKGADVFMPATGDELCPVQAFAFWRSALAGRGVNDGRALRRIDRWGHIYPALSGDGLNTLSKDLTKAAGCYVDGWGRTFTSHGWRASGYSAAKRAGASAEAARRHGRWSETSGVPDRVYDRAQDPVQDNPMAAVTAARRAAAGQGDADTVTP